MGETESSASGDLSSEPQVALLFFGVSLAIGAFCRQMLKNTRIPYTVALLLAGVVLGVLGLDRASFFFVKVFIKYHVSFLLIEFKQSTHLGQLGKSIRMCKLGDAFTVEI